MLPIRYTYAVLLPYVIIILLASSDGRREKKGVQKELVGRHCFLGPVEKKKKKNWSQSWT
ncbi:2-C-methyl-D-erythritol 2 [Plasmodium coatneyi]|uniref:2-C-methyl-D-erythritol 2 n=1 Tax=Plasmodium coatneyi TaxID=208452 RepID=A0A1B1DUS4_9APIC|nr:2-C-methyl-D-erythritol 2 [Plasmodium coatneyi]ANQ06399.1 2-C-methyl-D-erythritol 2 [Plasmodium coatneyi]